MNEECILCGALEFRVTDDGLQCVGCGAVKSTDEEEHGGFSDLITEYAADTQAFQRQQDAEEEEFWEREHGRRPTQEF